MFRRLAAAALVLLALTGCTRVVAPTSPTPTSPTPASPAPTSPQAPADVTLDLAALEAEFDARVGVSAVDTATGRWATHRPDERFGYASTIKALAAAAFLHDVPVADRETVVTWTAEDVTAAGYSPVTGQHLEDGLTLAQLAEATVRTSDNTALNLILDRLGGPAALDRTLESIGDVTTELVNPEPQLNTIEPGSEDDTSTPSAFTTDLAKILAGEWLTPADRALLLEWMSGNATGDALIRAAAPPGWTVADKSGGAGGIRNDVAVVTRPGLAPIVITIFTARNDPSAAYEDALVARAAELTLRAFD